MFTPKYMKIKFGKGFVYNPPEHLVPRYKMLMKYNLPEPLDEMVFEGAYELTSYLQLFKNIKEDDRISEFFEGTDLNLIDILDGDLSEIAPILKSRVSLYKYTYGSSVMEIMERFISSKWLLNNLYLDYFSE